MKSSLGYLPQLDGVRALAVVTVVLSHFMPATWSTARAVLPSGLSGVDVFFVLSGFLITGILLKGRQALERRRTSARAVFRAFYYRRALRIFPVYYLCLAWALVSGLGVTISALPWHALYLTNFWIFERASFPGSATHLWSLSVEEQFYFLWPFLVVSAPRKLLFALLGSFLLLGPAFRVWSWAHRSSFGYMLLPACADLFASGAILAVAYLRSPAACRQAGTVALLAALVILLLGLSVRWALPANAFWEPARRSLTGLTATWLISRAATGAPGALGTVLGSWPARWIGKVSYGIYLLHGFLPEALSRSLAFWGRRPLAPGIRFAVLCTGAIVAAAASWRFVEAPLLRLKDHGWGAVAELPGQDETDPRPSLGSSTP